MPIVMGTPHDHVTGQFLSPLVPSRLKDSNMHCTPRPERQRKNFPVLQIEYKHMSSSVINSDTFT